MHWHVLPVHCTSEISFQEEMMELGLQEKQGRRMF
jgi:hypothetical protein